MTVSPLSASLKIALLVALSPLALAQAPQTFTVKQIVPLAPGGDKERAGLSQLPGLADIVKGQFAIGAADLNADGSLEMILVSLVCDSEGCPVVVLQNAGHSKAIAPIFVRKIAGRVAVTREKVNGYYALAAADLSGAIMKDARTGQQIVYPVGAPTETKAAPPPTRPIAEKP
jgi:hypothetical protein